ncbi:Cys/Met metabolism PLP-dependent enzyme [Salegentibacter echinorum]|uniref:Cys/Met metabolism PLP-dependent enzyme n=2 Tax=Salegentibacter echinorum TaxID=1073325 RepID=A0A1M5BW41_SALEC|nr:Cys/Met metabolism PLP-dependent enzyme [Salegentibacter echinorum]
MYIIGLSKLILMKDDKMLNYISEVIANMPTDWLKLTTHRLDIYDEELAKTQFLEHFENLYRENIAETFALQKLPTAYDYIRLGHPLSCILEWAIAKSNDLDPENVIAFQSKTIPVLAILRKNLLDQKNTRILYTDKLPEFFDVETLREVYGYSFDLKKVKTVEEISSFDGSTVFISQDAQVSEVNLSSNIDFFINLQSDLGSVLVMDGKQDNAYVSEIQHVRRRETIAMTPANCLAALKLLVGKSSAKSKETEIGTKKNQVTNSINEITGTSSKVLVASCGLSMQYAIMMGLVHEALEKHKGKEIKFIVPPNCYGGTNDQVRRVAACLDRVEVLDMPVDGDNDMVQSIDTVLEKVAREDAVPYIIAEIPTNPRVEVPNLKDLRDVLQEKRKTSTDKVAIEPVFILDQTFCPNVQFLASDGILSAISSISYVSGSKFPSGGRCTAGYCVANNKAANLLDKVEEHLVLCDNKATNLQMEILAEQLPTMNQRIKDAYKNTREFVSFIQENLPEAKINFVSEQLANQGFTPSVFSLDLPTKGDTAEEREAYKRALNLKLINMMIQEIPNESKYCVSYGQLNGCYWTIPATSTQGTTKEADKDYIARVSLSPNLDLERHKEVFLDFVKQI